MKEVVMKWLLLVPMLLLATTGCTPAPQDATGESALDAGVTAQGGDEVGGTDDVDDVSAQPDLAAYHWRLDDATDADGQRIDALFVRVEQPVQLDFSDGHLGIGNTCNHMGAGYAIDGATLQVGRFASTLMACPDEALMALDREIGRRLEGSLPFSVEHRNDTPALVLSDAEDGILTFLGHATAETRYGGPGEVVFLEVAAQTSPCSHPLIPDMQCLQVREVDYDDDGVRLDTQEDFQHFYDGIEGYSHEPGVRNVLRVKRFARDPVPADVSDVAYVLDMVVSSEWIQE